MTNETSRRSFLAGLGATAGAAALVTGVTAAPKKKKSAADIIALGASGLKTSRLGIGTGSHGGKDQRSIGQAEFVKMIKHGYERGIRYIDTADRYQTHLFVRFALQELPRDEMFIQTKIWADNPAVVQADLDRCRRELGVKYLDSVLLHCRRTKGWTEDIGPAVDVLQAAKKKGQVRAIGVSCHGWDALVDSVGCDWIDIQLARINPFGSNMDGPHEDVVKQFKKMRENNNRGIIGMKIYGNGDFKDPQKRFDSVKYALGLDTVDAFTIGFSSIAQIDETFDVIEKASIAG